AGRGLDHSSDEYHWIHRRDRTDQRAHDEESHRSEEEDASGELLDEERGDWDHDAVDEHEARRHPLCGAGGDLEVVHERRQGGVEEGLVENDDERAGDKNGEDDVPVDRGALRRILLAAVFVRQWHPSPIHSLRIVVRRQLIFGGWLLRPLIAPRNSIPKLYNCLMQFSARPSPRQSRVTVISPTRLRGDIDRAGRCCAEEAELDVLRRWEDSEEFGGAAAVGTAAAGRARWTSPAGGCLLRVDPAGSGPAFRSGSTRRRHR